MQIRRFYMKYLKSFLITCWFVGTWFFVIWSVFTVGFLTTTAVVGVATFGLYWVIEYLERRLG